MQLKIYGERMIKEVQRDFSLAYPFLKLEFFKNGLIRRERYAVHTRLPENVKVKEAWFRKKEESVLELNNSMTVLQLENALMDRYSLSAQVYRRAGNLWLETTLTDNWSLKQQNDHGQELSQGKIAKHDINVDNDYDLTR